MFSDIVKKSDQVDAPTSPVSASDVGEQSVQVDKKINPGKQVETGKGLLGKSEADKPSAPLAPFTRPPSATLTDAAGGNQYIRQVAGLIPNVRMTNSHIVRGAQPTAETLALMKKGGVTTIINLRNEEVLVRQEEMVAKGVGLKFVSIPMNIFDEPSKLQINKFLTAVDTAPGKVYVHCLHGEDRTGTMIGIYRIAKDGWDGTRAYNEMVSYGFKPFLGNLSAAVFDYSAMVGRPVPRPGVNVMLSDLFSRIQKYVP
jgi:protein tyrosine phosphatase (PTP) superfamily phosphohydrolase (DUF442 family)